MNYQRIYDDLISRAQQRPPPVGYTEKHHILPKCIGGDNALCNIVILTAREHFICHWLLVKVHNSQKIVFAWRAMYTNPIGKRNNSVGYAMAKKAWAKAMRPLFLGKKASDETRKKQSLAKIGKPTWNKGICTGPQISNVQIEYEKDPKLCKNCGEPIPYRRGSNRNSRIFCGNSCSMIYRQKQGTAPVNFEPNSGSFAVGHVLGKETTVKISKTLTGLKRPRGCCIYCKTEGAISLLKRWHFDNCPKAVINGN